MLLACHLFFGALIGFIFYRWKGEVLAVPVAMIAALLPDLVDKPLGHLFLQEMLDNGRIIGHSLVFLAIVVAFAVLLCWKRHRILPAVLLVGVVSHLILDAMWGNPTTLLWPLLGPFAQDSYPDYFGSAVIAELTAPSEYAFMAGIVLIVSVVWRDRLGPGLRRIGDAMVRCRPAICLSMMLLGAAHAFLAGVQMLEGDIEAQNEMVLALALLLGGAGLWRLDPGREFYRAAVPAEQ